MSAWLTLVRLQVARLAELPDLRAARMYAFGLTLSFSLLAGLAPAAGPSFRNRLLEQALTAASWAVAGLCTLGLGRDLARRDRDEGFGALGHTRGFGERQLSIARAAAATLWLALAVALPTWLALGVLTLTGHAHALGWPLFWAAFSAAYALALAASLSGISWAARSLCPRDARLLIALFVLGPEFVRAAGATSLPTLPRAFAALLSAALAYGRTLP